MHKLALVCTSTNNIYLMNNRGAELLYGDRVQLSGATALNESTSRGSGKAGVDGSSDTDKAPPSTRSLSEEERLRLKERYSMEYSRYKCCCEVLPGTKL